MTATREIMKAWKKTTDKVYKKIIIELIGLGLCVMATIILPTLWWIYFIPAVFLTLSIAIDAIRLKILYRKIVLKWDYDELPWAVI